ncbi:MAG: DUF1887 domain-containing protein [Methanotrichaceae archaeon]
MNTAMLLLVGEQPAPNLLPLRHLKSDVATLIYTDYTKRVAENLRKILECDCNCLLCRVHPYNIPEIRNAVQRFLSENLSEHILTFNLTGGTKPMVLAAFSLAHSYGVSFLYFQTEGNCSQLHHYRFYGNEIRLERVEDVLDTISLDDYLRIYVGSYETGAPRNELERQVKEVLAATPGLEVLWSICPQGLDALEIDCLIRLGNQVGVGEIKTKGAKSGIDQINAVAEQRYLGTYVRKFLVSANPLDWNNSNLAQAYGIKVIEATSYSETGSLNVEDRQKLAETVVDLLGGSNDPSQLLPPSSH